MNTESLIKNIHKFESDIEGLNSSLETKVQQFVDGYANVEYFSDLVVAKGTSNEDYIPAINKCLELYNNCYIPNNIQIASKIILKSYQKIKLAHKFTTVSAKVPFIGSCMLGLYDKDTIGFEITNGRFFGNMTLSGQTDNFNGLDLTNENQERDTMARISNVTIEQVPKNGFIMKGRGESFVDNITVRWVRGQGFVLACADTFFTKLSSGIVQGSAFDIDCYNCSFSQCKGWFGDIGLNLTGKRNNFFGCELQDNVTHLQISGESNQFYGLYLESVGQRGGTTGSVDNSSNIILTESAFNNTIYGRTDDRKQFISSGTQGYVLDINPSARYNKIIIECRNVKVAPIKYASAVGDYNKVVIWGQKTDYSYIYYNNETETKNTTNITKGTCDNLTANVVMKNGIKQLTLNASNTTQSRFIEGCMIATISESSFRPDYSVDIIGNCFDSSDKPCGTCTLSINKSNGTITVWNINSTPVCRIKTNSIMI